MSRVGGAEAASNSFWPVGGQLETDRRLEDKRRKGVRRVGGTARRVERERDERLRTPVW